LVIARIGEYLNDEDKEGRLPYRGTLGELSRRERLAEKG